MTAQLDLDQGGTFREYQNFYLGPSIGWVLVPQTAVYSITAAGLYNLADLGATYIAVNAAAAVTIVLPVNELNDTAPAVAHPGRHFNSSLIIADVGGNAVANPITIQPPAGDTIMGLASIQITTAYGSFTLYLPPDTRTWVLE